MFAFGTVLLSVVPTIPAVAVFNYFQGRVTAALADAETLGHVLLAHLRADGTPHSERRSAPESQRTLAQAGAHHLEPAE